jgi:hypothetical protein
VPIAPSRTSMPQRLRGPWRPATPSEDKTLSAQKKRSSGFKAPVLKFYLTRPGAYRDVLKRSGSSGFSGPKIVPCPFSSRRVLPSSIANWVAGVHRAFSCRAAATSRDACLRSATHQPSGIHAFSLGPTLAAGNPNRGGGRRSLASPLLEGKIRVKNRFRTKNRPVHRQQTPLYQILTNPIAHRIAGRFFAGCRGPNEANRGTTGEARGLPAGWPTVHIVVDVVRRGLR